MSSDSDMDDEDEEPVQIGGGGEGEGEGPPERSLGIPSVPITQEMMEKGLRVLAKIGDGLQHTFIKVKLNELLLTDLSRLRQFPHLRVIDVASNYIEDLSPLNSLQHLLELDAPYNAVSNMLLLLPRRHLQALDVSFNKLTTTFGLHHPRLRYLNMNHNQIIDVTGLDPMTTRNITIIEFRGNHLTDEGLEGLSVLAPSLEVLYLAQNNVTSLRWVAPLKSLRRLHARGNRIKTLEGLCAELTELEYLNVRENEIADLLDLRHLKVLSRKFRFFNMIANPLSGGTEEEPEPVDGYRLEVLINAQYLFSLDKVEVDAEEREEAREMRKERELRGEDGEGLE